VSENQNLVGRLAIKARQIRPGTAQMIPVKKGQLVQIVDLKGKQVSDFVAFNANDKAEYLSVSVTRGANNNVMLQTGQTLYSNRRNPMFEMVDDTVGRHDTLFPACDPKRYEALDAPGHANCRTALAEALEGFGVSYDEMPDPINWFMNLAIRQRGELEIREPLSEPGDQVQLVALMDVVIAATACPQDLNPVNGGQPTDILVRVYREAAPAPAEPEAAESSEEAAAAAIADAETPAPTDAASQAGEGSPDTGDEPAAAAADPASANGAVDTPAAEGEVAASGDEAKPANG
jgi:uncharacterized protein YcgI (DUF1989 family)